MGTTQDPPATDTGGREPTPTLTLLSEARAKRGDPPSAAHNRRAEASARGASRQPPEPAT